MLKAQTRGGGKQRANATHRVPAVQSNPQPTFLAQMRLYSMALAINFNDIHSCLQKLVHLSFIASNTVMRQGVFFLGEIKTRGMFLSSVLDRGNEDESVRWVRAVGGASEGGNVLLALSSFAPHCLQSIFHTLLRLWENKDPCSYFYIFFFVFSHPSCYILVIFMLFFGRKCARDGNPLGEPSWEIYGYWVTIERKRDPKLDIPYAVTN